MGERERPLARQKQTCLIDLEEVGPGVILGPVSGFLYIGLALKGCLCYS